METLNMERLHAQEMIDQALGELPFECCGVLAGNNGRVARVYRATNIDKSPVKYTIDPKELDQIFRDAERNKLEVLAFYHSHTSSEAYPSVTDVKLIPWPDWFDYFYVIVSLRDRNSPQIRAFKIVNKDIREVTLEIAG